MGREFIEKIYGIPNGHLISGLVKTEKKKGPHNVNIGHAYFCWVKCSVYMYMYIL